MPSVTAIQTNWTAGEISPRLYGRVDIERYAAGAAQLGISESALKARLATARKKLFARTSAEAIQRAKDYRLL